MYKKGNAIIIFLVIVIIILGYFLLTKDKSNVSDNLNQNSSNTNTQPVDNTLIKKCTDSFNACKEVIQTKYGYKVTLNKMQEFDNYEDANEFYNTWKSYFDTGLPSLFSENPYSFDKEQLVEDNFPIILIAMSREDVNKIPSVIGCGNDGKLTSYSRTFVQC